MLQGVIGHCTSPHWLRTVICCLLACLCLPTVGCQSVPFIRGQSPDDARSIGADYPEASVKDAIVDIVVEGNVTIETGAILAQVKSQRGRPADERVIKEDLRALYATRWFYSVERRYRMSDDGMLLIFRVVERPVVKSVQIKGNEKLRTKTLLKQINIEAGSPYDVSMNKSAARNLEKFYHEKKSYPFAKVTLESGSKPEDRDVIFVIEEGDRVIVSDINFLGNTSFSEALLKTKLKTKTAFFDISLFGGKYDESTIPDDIIALREYYNGLGYFDVQIEKDVAVKENWFHILPKNQWLPRVDARATYTYRLTEGPRYTVRNIEIAGNEIFSEAELREASELNAGDKFNSRFLNKDVDRIKEKYGKLGRLFAKVEPVPRFLPDRPGEVDLVVRIDEDRPYTIRDIDVHINAPGGHPHTRETVVLNRVMVAPGELADPFLINRSKSRLRGQIFENGGPTAPRVEVTKVEEKKKPTPGRDHQVVRGQDTMLAQRSAPNLLFENNTSGDPWGGLEGPYGAALDGPGEIDIDVDVTEAQTGRLMFGVGVNSNAGVIGQFTLEENNFDITRPPTSWRDLVEGSAWRGNGQKFRIEAMPGQNVSRYMVSWMDPYFLDTDYNFGVSGFYYNRYQPGWNEDRAGGRLTLGRQLDRWWSVTSALRLEDVSMYDFQVPPALLTPRMREVNGHNTLTTARISVAHDTRDSTFMPTDGHFAELAFEQGFGEFMYPRFELQATQHWSPYERVDGTGKHVLTVHGEANWTDSGTPLFERYFAGGYQSFRGFAYRGVGPLEQGIRVGGNTMLLGSAEYSIPVTADDSIRVVGFTDFGTVEQDLNSLSSDSFRLAVGFGFRVAIPIMGPAPLAFDFGFPVLKEPGDHERVFSFTVGWSR